MKSSTYYLLNNVYTVSEIQQTVKDFLIIRFNSCIEEVSIFDTFDWCLFNNKTQLQKVENEYKLISISTNELKAPSIQFTKKNNQFWWFYPQSAFRNILKKHISIRALFVDEVEGMQYSCIYKLTTVFSSSFKTFK